jgi:uncharacterized RDD family membrane protein YckC
MNRALSFVTPENVVVSYTLAGVASRLLATFIDLLIQFALLLFCSGVFQQLGGGLRGTLGLGSLTSALGLIVSYIIMFFYSLLFEAFWGGRTPGKRLLGLRVIQEGGYPVTFAASATRNLLRLLDFGIFPLGNVPVILFGLPGLLSVFFSPTYRRIGDYVAGTLVISEQGANPFAKETQTPLTPQAAQLVPYLRNLYRITPKEYQAVRRFVERRPTFELSLQAGLAERLARPLMEKCEIVAPIVVQNQYADLLEALERQYTEERASF